MIQGYVTAVVTFSSIILYIFSPFDLNIFYTHAFDGCVRFNGIPSRDQFLTIVKEAKPLILTNAMGNWNTVIKRTDPLCRS